LTEEKKRLLIIGANGFVGERLGIRATDAYDVFRADLAAPAKPDELQMDVTDPVSVRAGFEAVRPHAVVLLAAIADIDLCERQPDLAQAVNVIGAVTVAGHCAASGARLLYASSAAVYDGSRHGYTEADRTTPVSIYGRTKAQAEIELKKILPEVLILRPALVLGFSAAPGTNAMLNKLAESFRAGKVSRVPDYEYRNPIDADTLCQAILGLTASQRARGIYHIGATDSISRFDLVCRLADRLGFPRTLVEAQREPLPGRAPRGLDHFLLADRLGQETGIEMPTCDEVLERCLHATA
jgi:dTDP-4-dehydrorhamnose reductase